MVSLIVNKNGVMRNIFSVNTSLLFVATLMPCVWVRADSVANSPAQLQPVGKEMKSIILQSFTPSAPFYNGALAVTGYAKVDTPENWRTWLSVQSINSQGQTTRSSYSVKSGDVVFGLQFSPDGKTLLLKVGWPFDRYGGYRIYLLDIKTQELRPAPIGGLLYEKIFWSPDSRYFAYVTGGDIEGNEWPDSEPLELFIYDTATQKSYRVAKNPAIRTLAWDEGDVLLYNFAPPADLSCKKVDKNAVAALADVYTFDAAHLEKVAQPTKLLSESFGPVPSPGGKWIALWSRPTAEEKALLRATHKTDTEAQNMMASDTTAHLFLYDRATKKRFLQFPLITPGKFSSLLWTHDGKRLIAMQYKYSRNIGTLDIYEIETADFSRKHIATLSAKDSEPISRPRTEPQYQALNISSDDKNIFVKISKVLGKEDDMDKTEVSVKSINLLDDSIANLAITIEPLGLDWWKQ